MNNPENIQLTLEYLSITVLGGLVIFQLKHFIIGSWTFWKGSKWRMARTIGIGLFWICNGLFFVLTVTNINSYVNSIPYILCGLYLPSVLAMLLLATSKQFRGFVDKISLKWSIQSVAGPARMMVGIIFLFWFFAGRLPGIFALIAGPGDWIAGVITFYAVSQLDIFKQVAGIKANHWSISDFKKNNIKSFFENQSKLNKNLNVAIAFVAFGILDFILAPASTAVSILNGNIPEELGQIPLTLIPLILVPQVLLLEVFAMRQLIGFKKILKSA